MADNIALIIDDEPDILQLLNITLGRMKIDAVSAANVTEALEHLKNKKFDLCLTDMRLPDGDGMEVVQYIQEQQLDIPVAVITAHGNMETAIDAMKAGAFDFISKPIDLNNLRKIINSALKVNQSQSIEPKGGQRFIGNTPNMVQLQQTILKLSKSQAPVYIKGESGTGKELVAKLIHKKGPRADQPFVPVNCGAIPSELMESEFFGHMKGSFTGAVSEKKGLFQAAEGGTLFLDEIADLPAAMQVKLLRAIQEKAVRPVGAEKEEPIDVRILSASHKDLAKLVDAGEFRRDLFYRINVIEVVVPALRDRRDDIPSLAKYVIQRVAKNHGIKEPTISDNALAELKRYDFPGNIRELENILERALTLSMGDTIGREDLNLPHTLSSAPLEQTTPSPAQSLPTRNGLPLEEFLEKVERIAIEEALNETGGNKTAAAKVLGISFRAMRYRLKKLDME